MQKKSFENLPLVPSDFPRGFGPLRFASFFFHAIVVGQLGMRSGDFS